MFRYIINIQYNTIKYTIVENYRRILILFSIIFATLRSLSARYNLFIPKSGRVEYLHNHQKDSGLNSLSLRHLVSRGRIRKAACEVCWEYNHLCVLYVTYYNSVCKQEEI